MSTSSSIPVLAAVIRRGDRLLVCQRPRHKRHGGLWEFPGGKLEPGESIEEAARRELSEELGVAVIGVGDAELEVADPGSAFVIRFHAVEIDAAPEPVPIEHEAIVWATVDELLALPLAPSDRAFALTLMDRRGVGRELSSRAGHPPQTP